MSADGMVLTVLLMTVIVLIAMFAYRAGYEDGLEVWADRVLEDELRDDFREG